MAVKLNFLGRKGADCCWSVGDAGVAEAEAAVWSSEIPARSRSPHTDVSISLHKCKEIVQHSGVYLVMWNGLLMRPEGSPESTLVLLRKSLDNVHKGAPIIVDIAVLKRVIDEDGIGRVKKIVIIEVCAFHGTLGAVDGSLSRRRPPR